jgi:hypothetical protein
MSRTERLIILPLLCLLVVLPFWKVALGQGIVISNDYAVSDSANLQHPLRHFAGDELRQGRLPLWTPGVYMGYPLLAEGQAGLFYPPNLLLFGSLPSLAAFNVSMLLPFIIAALGAFVLARELGAGAAGALLAGLAYALSGFFVVHVKHKSMVDAACWIPALLWLVERGLKRSDGALLGLGAVMGAQWLTGAPQIAYYATGMTVLYFTGRAWQSRAALCAAGRSLRRAVLLLALALFLSLGLGVIQLLPTYELVGFSERADGVGYEFAAAFPYAPDNLKTFFYPLVNGDPGTGDYDVSGIFWEDYAYLGLVPLLLGLLGGLVLARRPGPARLLSGLAALTFTLALGANTPFYRLAYYMIPGMGFFRFPQRFLAFSVLFVILLAALTLTRIQEWLPRRYGRYSNALGIFAVLLALVDLYAYHAPWNAIVDAETWLEPPATARAMQERAGASLYRVYSFDVYNTFRAAYRQAGGWRGSLAPYVAQRDFLQPCLNLVYDVPAADGYVNLTPDWLTLLWGNEKQLGLMDQSLAQDGEQLTARAGFVKLFSLYNVRFLLAAYPVQDEAFELVGVYDSGAYLYENLHVLPRAFVVPGYAVVQGDLQSALNWMRTPAFDPTTTVVLLEMPDAPLGPAKSISATAEVMSYEANRVVVEAESDGPGWLVLSDTYYPGWQATLDGQPTTIYQANGSVRAVYLPAGEHEIIFRYRPRSFYTGAWISGVSGVLLLAAWATLRRCATFGSP